MDQPRQSYFVESDNFAIPQEQNEADGNSFKQPEHQHQLEVMQAEIDALKMKSQMLMSNHTESPQFMGFSMETDDGPVITNTNAGYPQNFGRSDETSSLASQSDNSLEF